MTKSDSKNFDERNMDEMLVKALIFVLYCMHILHFERLKVWQFDPDSSNSSKFPLVKVSGFTVASYIAS